MNIAMFAALAILAIGAMFLFRVGPGKAGPLANDVSVKADLIAFGWKSDELRRILGDFSASYDMDSLADLALDIVQYSDGSLRVNLGDRLTAEKLVYLVNYAQYPRGFDLKTRSIVMAARSTISPAFSPPQESLLGQDVLIFVPSNDTEFDLVHLGFSDETFFAMPFTSLQWTKAEAPRLPSLLRSLLEPEQQ